MQVYKDVTITVAGAAGRIQVSSIAPDRKAYVIKNNDTVAIVKVSNKQNGDGLQLEPRQIFGRDIFTPIDAIWIEASAVPCIVTIVEDY